MKKNNQALELKVGLFVTIGILLISVAILMLGGADSVFTRYAKYRTHFPNTDGLIIGSKVLVAGIHVGSVEQIEFKTDRGDVELTLRINREFTHLVRQDSMAEISTLGMLGDKYISLTAGGTQADLTPEGGEIPSAPIRDLGKFVSKGDQLLVNLNQIASSLDRLLKTFETGNRSEIIFSNIASTSKNLSLATERLNKELENLKLNSTLGHVNSILKKIDGGSGTIGALVNDPGLYYDARALMGGANRNRVVRNLVRKTVKDAETEESKNDSP